MIRQITAICIKELKVLWKDKEALALLFLMPAFFILVMSFALQGVFDTGSKKQPIRILLINQDRGKIAEKVIKDLSQQEGIEWISQKDEEPISRKHAEALIRKKEFSLSLVFADNFSENILTKEEADESHPPTVTLIVDPALNRQLLAPIEGAIRSVIERHAALFRIRHALKQNLGPLMGWMAQGPGSPDKPSHPIDDIFKEFDEDGETHTGVVFNTQPPEGLNIQRRPSATEQNVPAYTIFGVFFIMLTLASGIHKEKADGTFQRLLAAPLSKTALLMGKLLPYHLVNLIQIALMFSIGVFVFHMNLGNFPALLIVSISLSIAANGLGLLVAAFSHTYAQVNGFSVLLAVTLSALGGMMVPAFIMPDTLKTLSLFTPHAWALTAYHDIIIRGLSVKDILAESAVLLGFAAVFFAAALWRFRFQ